MKTKTTKQYSPKVRELRQANDGNAPTNVEFYEFLSHQIEREDALINTRLTWYLTVESILFAALALIGNKNEIRENIYQIMSFILPVVGIVISILAFDAVNAALSSLQNLKSIWLSTDISFRVSFPPPYGGDKEHANAARYSLYLPVIILVAWELVFIWLHEVFLIV